MMDAARWENIKMIFGKVLKAPPHERTAFLDRACGSDAALRTEVKTLLDSSEEAAGYFDDLAGSILGAGWIAGEQTEPLPVEAAPADPHQLIGQTVSHYEVHEKLGGGGMGVVYRAEDTQLGRSVALKFLLPHLSADDDTKTRFKVEAQAASALDHTNICTIYEIGETEAGQLFIAMAYYDGESLKKKIARGPLPVEEVLDYGMQVARGLSKAHARGIIHRDIKPANVMVTSDGVVKIVDFGLAKMTDVSLTQTGMMLGTVAYMSPEQARGVDIDHQTDVWSLGVVLFEMLTGERPFKGDYAQAIIYSVLHEDPGLLTELNEDVPPDLEHVVAMCLEKDKTLRYPTVADLLADLDVLVQGSESQALLSRTLPATGTSRLDRSAQRHARLAEELAIVVLPFEDISPGKDNEYFSDGLTEEIITDLSQVQALNVISRTSAMMLKGTDKSVKAIGRELNVGYVLEGSVRKAGNHLRITAQLIDARTDMHLWAEKYKGTLDDIFDIQETVSRSIVEALKLKLSPEEEQRIGEHPIDNVHAYECYLRARQEIFRFTEDALDRGLRYLQNGLDIVGENVLLYAGMGYVYWQYVNVGIKPEETLTQAEDYAKKVFELEPESLHGYRLLGLIAAARGHLQDTARYLKRVLASDPNDLDALTWLCLLYEFIGKTAAARPLSERLLRIDPLSPMNTGHTGKIYIAEGRFDLALDPYRKMYRMDPENPVYLFLYAHLLAYTQSFEQAYPLLDRLVEIAPEHPLAWLGQFFTYVLQGKKAKALEATTPKLKAMASGNPQYSWFMAEGYALIDEKEQALDWLENAVARGFINYPMLSLIDPFLVPVRSEERFQRLVENVKMKWERFEV